MSTSKFLRITSKEIADSLAEFYTPLYEKAKKEYEDLKEVIETLSSYKEDSPETEWSPENWADRIILALNIIGKECSSKEIIAVIIQNEPDPELKRTASKSVSSALLSLEKKNKVVRKDSGQNKKLISLPEWK